MVGRARIRMVMKFAGVFISYFWLRLIVKWVLFHEVDLSGKFLSSIVVESFLFTIVFLISINAIRKATGPK